MTISSMAAGVTGDIVTADKYNSLLSLRSVSGGYVTRSGTNLLFAPAVGIHVLCYESSTWVPKLIPAAGITVACTGLTVSTAYYLYVYDNAGTLTLDLSTTAPTTQDGIYVKTGVLTRTLIARCYADASGNITTYAEDASTQLVCNIYNKRIIGLVKVDTTDSWTYSLATYQQARAQTGNRILAVCDGVSSVQVIVSIAGTNSGNNWDDVGVGVDSTTVNSATLHPGAYGTTWQGVTAYYNGVPAAGYHAFNWLERAYAGTATFYGGLNSDFTVGGIELIGLF